VTVSGKNRKRSR